MLRAYVEYVMTGSPTAITDGTWAPQLQQLLTAESRSDSTARLHQVATIFRTIAERMGLAWRLTRDGAAVDPGVAEDYAELAHLQRPSMSGLLEGIDEHDL